MKYADFRSTPLSQAGIEDFASENIAQTEEGLLRPFYDRLKLEHGSLNGAL
jgi:hypothetical protein